jgi:hypothetical protein
MGVYVLKKKGIEAMRSEAKRLREEYLEYAEDMSFLLTPSSGKRLKK